jgi:hypothetical protein
MVIEINFGKNKKDDIVVHFGDNPTLLAETFVKKHKLKERAVPTIVNHIIDTVEAHLQAAGSLSPSAGKRALSLPCHLMFMPAHCMPAHCMPAHCMPAHCMSDCATPVPLLLTIICDLPTESPHGSAFSPKQGMGGFFRAESDHSPDEKQPDASFVLSPISPGSVPGSVQASEQPPVAFSPPDLPRHPSVVSPGEASRHSSFDGLASPRRLGSEHNSPNATPSPAPKSAVSPLSVDDDADAAAYHNMKVWIHK